MKEIERERIAQQKYDLIAPIVKHPSESMGRGERYAILRSIAEGKYPNLLPEGKKVGLRTLERYLQLYEQGGFEALKPNMRDRSRKIPSEYLEAAAELKRENMQRSINTIITLLEQAGKVPNGVLKPSTVYDFFSQERLTRPFLLPAKNGQYTKFGAHFRGEILQGDVHHTMKLPDPSRPGQERQIYLFAWLDDYSRLVFGQFYWKEKLPALEDSLMKWIFLYGVPLSIYCDNGAVYSSHHLQNICASLGIQLHHSRPYRPQGRGKVEKFFQFVESSFKSEVQLLVKQEKISTLNDLNNLFSLWLDKFYNRKFHSATKQAPLSRWEGNSYQLKHPPVDTVREAFLWKDERTVSLTGIISVDTNQYEVEPFLCGKKVTLRYDPYDLSRRIRVFYDGRQFKDAVPAKIHRHSKKGFQKDLSVAPPATGLNFLEQLAKTKLTKRQALSFSGLEGDLK